MRRIALIIVVCAMYALPCPVRAQEGPGTPVPLQVWLRHEANRFADARFTAFATAGKNKFAFLVPDGYLLRGDPTSGTLTLKNVEGNCSLTFRLLSSGSSDGTTDGDDAFRDSVLREFPSWKIVQEFPVSVVPGKGSGFDLQWKASGTIVECKRVLFVSTLAGMMEITATTSSNHFDSLKSILGSTLMTFRLSTDGVLKVPPLPTES